MLEMGHNLALDTLPKKTGAIKVRLIISNPELVNLYKERFSAKQAQADRRVTIIWEDLASFLSEL